MEALKEASEQIENEIILVCFHMNGVTYNEAWGMSALQRDKILDFIADIKKKEAELISGKKQL